MSHLKKKLPSLEEVFEEFCVSDVHINYIPPSLLIHALRRLGLNPSRDRVDNALRALSGAAAKRNGRIELCEF